MRSLCYYKSSIVVIHDLKIPLWGRQGDCLVQCVCGRDYQSSGTNAKRERMVGRTVSGMWENILSVLLHKTSLSFHPRGIFLGERVSALCTVFPRLSFCNSAAHHTCLPLSPKVKFWYGFHQQGRPSKWHLKDGFYF